MASSRIANASSKLAYRIQWFRHLRVHCLARGNMCRPSHCSIVRGLYLHSQRMGLQAFCKEKTKIFPGRTCWWTGVCRPVFRKQLSSNYRQLPSYPLLWWILAENYPFLAIFCQFLENPPMFKENLPKRGPLFREFGPKNPPIWVVHTRTLNMLCYPPPPGKILQTEYSTGRRGII